MLSASLNKTLLPSLDKRCTLLTTCCHIFKLCVLNICGFCFVAVVWYIWDFVHLFVVVLLFLSFWVVVYSKICFCVCGVFLCACLLLFFWCVFVFVFALFVCVFVFIGVFCCCFYVLSLWWCFICLLVVVLECFVVVFGVGF